VIAAERQMEKKERRLPRMVASSPWEVVVVSNLGPAQPKRRRRTAHCGMKAYLLLVSDDCLGER
jgi:hypothetical protein